MTPKLSLVARSKSRPMTRPAASAPATADMAAEAAAHDLGGKLLGLTLVLASAIFHSVHIWDLLFWGAVGIVSQVVVAKLFERVTPYRVSQEIPKGNVAVGIFSARLSVAAGLLLAALISY